MKCEFCLRDFLRGSELQRHIQIHQKENIATCEFCGFAYGTIHDLNGHINKVHPEKKSQIKKKYLKCESCTREFLGSNQLHRHIQIHQKENNVTCEFCGFVYPYTHKGLLNKHLIEVHPDKMEKENQCKFCNNFHVSKYCLTRHIKKVHPEKIKSRYQCEFCDNCYVSKGALTRHIETVHPEKVYYKCEFCNETFNTISFLKSHLEKVHPIKCEVCQKTFKDKTSLTKHKKLVHEERKCKFCNRELSSRNELDIHIKIHQTMVPSYTCEICGFAYSGKGDLTKHIAKIHPEKKISLKKNKKYHCDFCHKSYDKMNDLMQHTETSHHTEDIDVTDTMDDLDFAMAVFEDGKTTCKLFFISNVRIYFMKL